MVPVYKKGATGDVANYRPISLTCVCSKIMERVIVKHARSQGGGSTGSIEPPQPEPRPTLVAIIRTTIVPSRYLFLNLNDYFGVCPVGGLNNDYIGECR